MRLIFYEYHDIQPKKWVRQYLCKRMYIFLYICIFPCQTPKYLTYFLNDLSSFLVFCSLITIFPSQRMVMAKCCGTYFKSGLFLSIEISGHVLNLFHRWGQTNYETYLVCLNYSGSLVTADFSGAVFTHAHIQLRDHSITTWTRCWGRGSKNVFFCPRSGYENDRGQI